MNLKTVVVCSNFQVNQKEFSVRKQSTDVADNFDIFILHLLSTYGKN